MKTIALYQAFRHNGLEYPQNVEHGIIEAQSREGRRSGSVNRVPSVVSSSDTWSASIVEQGGGDRSFHSAPIESLQPIPPAHCYESTCSTIEDRPSSPRCPRDSSFFPNVTASWFSRAPRVPFSASGTPEKELP